MKTEVEGVEMEQTVEWIELDERVPDEEGVLHRAGGGDGRRV